MKDSLITLNQNIQQTVFSFDGDTTKGVYSPQGIKHLIVFEQQNILSANYYRFTLNQSIIPLLFHIEGNLAQTNNKSIEWRVYHNDLILTDRQIISIDNFTVEPYGYSFNFAYPFAIHKPEDISVSVYLKANVDLSHIKIFCEPCFIHPNPNKSASILTTFPT